VSFPRADVDPSATDHARFVTCGHLVAPTTTGYHGQMLRRMGGLGFGLAIVAACTGRPDSGAAGTGRGAPSISGAGRTSLPDVPKDPTFVGAEGADEHGYPLRRPDKIALQTLLRLDRFADLDRWIEFYQAQFEADPNKEYWSHDVVVAFLAADPTLGPKLDAWVGAAPGSFAAKAARGAWHEAMGFAKRGTKTRDETSPEQFAEMRRYHAKAIADFEAALSTRPRAMGAHEGLIAIARADGDPRIPRQRLDAALAQCRSCFGVRAEYIIALTPRWGGSHREMRAFVAETTRLVEAHPKLRLLAGYVPWDRCRTAAADDNPAAALAACDEAVAVGEHPRFLTARARVLNRAKRHDEAQTVLARALRLAPQDEEALFARHIARRETKDVVGAAEDLLVAYRLDPSAENMVDDVDWMVKKLVYDGQELGKAGKHDDAAKRFDLAAALAPDDASIRNRQVYNAAAAGADDLAARVSAAPDDFDLRLQLDHALATERRFAEIVASWDDYITRHPDDGRAFRERGGARWHLGQRDEGIADTEKACELGNPKACGDVPKMKARRDAGR
jgi:tetratricopeptide (TPR) repeat protein